MSIFEKLHQQGQQQQRQISQDEMRTEIGRIQADPGAYLQQRGFTIPQGMTDPRQITQHLLQSGQVGQGRLQQVMRMLGR
jgi:hypothetical protein